jgi:anti-sigma regulatory factor (Ser/Thr protein kinase)
MGDLATVLSFVETFARERTIASGRITAARLAVEELLTRCVDYSLGPAHLHIWTSDTDIVVEVVSTGRLASPFAGYLPPTMSDGVEHGLWLAGQQCDLIAVRQHEDCTTVRLHISDYLVSARPTCDGIDTLLGVFVLRACDPAEERMVRTHLATCAACRAEVDRLGQVVGLMDHPSGSTRP